MDLNILLSILLINSFVILFNLFYIIVYKFLNFYKMSYFFIVFLGIFLGMAFSFLLRGDKYEINDYLAVISYFVVDIIFVSYSLYFEKEGKKVFN